jgi:hypothetical protein
MHVVHKGKQCTDDKIRQGRTGRRFSTWGPWRLPSEPMLLANLRIDFADFPECTFFYVPEHFMLGDLMR